MVLFTRAVARDFQALLSRCCAGRPRGPAPPVLVRVTRGTRALASTTPEGVTLTHTSQARTEPDDLIVLPGTVLTESGGGTDEPVTLDKHSRVRGVVKWPGAGTPRTVPVDLIVPGTQHTVPALPVLSPVPPAVLVALAECGRTAARENGRYALSKVQVQGRAGRVVGTDGKVALVRAGFNFPFSDDVLVSALPVFGTKPFASFPDVKLGRTPVHLVLAAGPWTVWVPTDGKAKYPDVVSVIPRHAPTTVTLSEPDAVELLRVLPGLPGADHECRPVTLDTDRAVRVRGYAEGVGTREVVLSRSSVSGPSGRVVLDRRVLGRALGLGCRTLKLTPNKPAVFDGNGFTLLAAQIDPDLAAPTAEGRDSKPLGAPPTLNHTHPNHAHINHERNTPMRPRDHQHQAQPQNQNQNRPPNPPQNPPPEPPQAEDGSDPLRAAEDLRTALAEVLAKATRLVAVLKSGKREKRALANVWAGLQRLNIGGTRRT